MLTQLTKVLFSLLVVSYLGGCTRGFEGPRVKGIDNKTKPGQVLLWSTSDIATAGDALWRAEGVYPSIQDTPLPHVLIVYVDHRKARLPDGSWPARGRVEIDSDRSKVVNVWGDYVDEEIERLDSLKSDGVIGGEEAINLATEYATRGTSDPSQVVASRRQIDLAGGRYWIIYFPLTLPAGTLGPGYRLRVTVDGLQRKALGLTLG